MAMRWLACGHAERLGAQHTVCLVHAFSSCPATLGTLSPPVHRRCLVGVRAAQSRAAVSPPATNGYTPGDASAEEFIDADPRYADSADWSATHLKKALRRRQHDSRPGSQSLTSIVRDVVRRQSLEGIAQTESR